MAKNAQSDPTASEIRAIAKDAYIYAYPMVDNARIQYEYFVDASSSQYKAPYNQLFNIPRVYTPSDTAIQTPNSDTPYSWVGLDLRAEPVVFILPKIDPKRYYSVQLIDLYTYNFAYLGTRTTGNDGGAFLVAGPSWNGPTPKGVQTVIRCDTEIASAQFRTQLYNPGDLDNVIAIQNKYVCEPLSAFLREPAPKPLGPVSLPPPLTINEERSSLQFFRNLNALLKYAPAVPSETALRARFASIRIEAGATFSAETFSSQIREALQGGIADAWEEFAGLKKRLEAGEVNSGDGFGTRAYLNGNYLYMMAGAVIGIYGNSKQEALYPTYFVDSDGQELTGSHCYVLHFAPGQLPPVLAFWSITMYDQPQSLLVANSLNRYLLNSTMLDQFKKDPDGGITLYFQHDPPDNAPESNWLPAPAGNFSVIMRLYLPKPSALDGSWKPPALKRVS